ncbi:PTS system, lactose/cellobiose family IIC component [Halobacteroides halobius DSM 5150]|uniref:Permease IIC component n=1 Tax=Halobacteroides halobius (strain ATCC 35273 / DSM 5150 / MD-1) TaxID=748449 RepID=L0KDG2_HALHC|nr:PTS transporter subunit EIIC [Halobacteroides halobius]AGB42409.1 PTS system, lactose/cellobiose family IIC component [Halobacteroides halobius DSM 5150]
MSTKMFDKVEQLLQRYLMPLANKIQSQRHIQAVRDGMVSLMPVLIVGCLSLLISAIPNLIPNGMLVGFEELIKNNAGVIMFPFKLTIGLLSLFSAFSIAYHLGKRYDLYPLGTATSALIVQLLVCAKYVDGKIIPTYLDAKGIFASIIIGLLTVEVAKFLDNHAITFNLPDSVPPSILKTFQSIIPLFVNVVLFYSISLMIKAATGVIFPELLMNTLAPAINSLDSPLAFVVLILITQLLWFVGLHGYAITSSIFLPLGTQYLAANAAAQAAGEPLTYVFTHGFYVYFLLAGGSGLTGGLAALMLFSDSDHLKQVGKLGIVPAIFNVNEPIIFGLPIVLNPIMFIPFVLGPTIVGLISYLVIDFGFVAKPFIDPPLFLPAPLGAFMTNMDWRSVILCVFNLVLSTVIYYPFFKMMEKKEVKKERKVKEEKAEAAGGTVTS